MKKAIIGTALLIAIPFTASAWDNRGNDWYESNRRAETLDRMADEMQRANDIKERQVGYDAIDRETERFERDQRDRRNRRR